MLVKHSRSSNTDHRHSAASFFSSYYSFSLPLASAQAGKAWAIKHIGRERKKDLIHDWLYFFPFKSFPRRCFQSAGIGKEEPCCYATGYICMCVSLPAIRPSYIPVTLYTEVHYHYWLFLTFHRNMEWPQNLSTALLPLSFLRELWLTQPPHFSCFLFQHYWWKQSVSCNFKSPLLLVLPQEFLGLRATFSTFHRSFLSSERVKNWRGE